VQNLIHCAKETVLQRKKKKVLSDHQVESLDNSVYFKVYTDSSQDHNSHHARPHTSLPYTFFGFGEKKNHY